MRKLILILLLGNCLVLAHPLKAQQPDSIPVVAVGFDSIPRLDSVPDIQIAGYSWGLAAETRRMLAILQGETGQKTAERAALDSIVAVQKPDTTIAAADKAIQVGKLKDARAAEKTALKNQKQAEKALVSVEKLCKMAPAAQRKNLPKTWLEVQKIDRILHPPAPKKETPVAVILEEAMKRKVDTTQVNLNAGPVVADTAKVTGSVETKPEKPAKGKSKAKVAEKPNARFRAYEPEKDVMLHPPQEAVTLAYNVRDEFSGEVRREVNKSEIFRYTNPLLRKYMQGKTHIICEAALGTAGQNLTLSLTYNIHDSNAKKAFGGVARNAVLMLKFVDGTTITGYNIRPDEGVYDPNKQLAVYRVQYAFDRGFLKKMRTMELDKIRMAWSTGYEDYDVQQIDLLMRQSKIIE